jgi:hypothetical protein
MSILNSAKGKFQRIQIDWDSIDGTAIPAGTPLGADGQIHNDGAALGILTSSVSYPWNGTGDILTAGYVDRAEAEAASGLVLSNEAQAALHDVKFDSQGKINSMVAVAG